MSTRTFIRRAERVLAGVRDLGERKRRARQLARDAQQRGRKLNQRLQHDRTEERRAQDVLRSPYARRWLQYIVAGALFGFVDAAVQGWIFGKLTALSVAGAVAAGAVTAGFLAAVVHLIGWLYLVDVHDEEATRRRLSILFAIGLGLSVTGAVAYRAIGTLAGHDAAVLVRTVGWMPFLALSAGLPMACGSLTSLGAYYRDARRIPARIAKSSVLLSDLAAVYHQLISVPEPCPTESVAETARTPAWLTAGDHFDIFGVSGADVEPSTSAGFGNASETVGEASPTPTSPVLESPKKRRGRPSRPRPTIPDPVQDSFGAPDFNSGPKNGNNGGEPIIPPIVRGLALFVCLLLGGRALAASCFIGTDGTASNNPSELGDVGNFTVSTAHELTAVFGCDTVVTSVVTDQGRWTPRRWLPVPVHPATHDCSTAISEPSSDAAKLYETFRSLQDEDDRNARLTCERKNQESLRVFDEAQHDFENQLRASLTVHEARDDVRSPIFAWLAGAVSGSESPALVVLIGDGLENPPWPRPLPHLVVPPGTTIVLLLVPPRPLYRDPQRALADVEAWYKVVPGIVLVPAPELRPGIWTDIARRRRS